MFHFTVVPLLIDLWFHYKQLNIYKLMILGIFNSFWRIHSFLLICWIRKILLWMFRRKPNLSQFFNKVMLSMSVAVPTMKPVTMLLALLGKNLASKKAKQHSYVLDNPKGERETFWAHWWSQIYLQQVWYNVWCI